MNKTEHKDNKIEDRRQMESYESKWWSRCSYQGVCRAGDSIPGFCCGWCCLQVLYVYTFCGFWCDLARAINTRTILPVTMSRCYFLLNIPLCVKCVNHVCGAWAYLKQKKYKLTENYASKYTFRSAYLKIFIFVMLLLSVLSNHTNYIRVRWSEKKK